MDELAKFVIAVLEGNLKPHLKSEPIPEPNDDPVKVGIIGKACVQLLERLLLLSLDNEVVNHCNINHFSAKSRSTGTALYDT